eukprot:gb/GEZJ01007667.1/.p1 GENE.gb/GEZJ01007667.1/~~gb/GEZJ01007667.1/.p1  ORF type:complete len:155 (-),score=31.64 gb/GEZJ01007667.1/:360-824(-)
MTARFDMGEGVADEVMDLISDQDADDEADFSGKEISEDETVEEETAPRARSTTPSVSPSFPLVQKRARRTTSEEGESVLELFKASMLQDREVRTEERERLAQEREDDKVRRRESSEREEKFVRNRDGNGKKRGEKLANSAKKTVKRGKLTCKCL